MSSTDLVSPEGSSMIMVLNLRANYSIGFMKYQIQDIASTAYNLAANGLAEVFNKTIIKLLKKFISAS